METLEKVLQLEERLDKKQKLELEIQLSKAQVHIKQQLEKEGDAIVKGLFSDICDKIQLKDEGMETLNRILNAMKDSLIQLATMKQKKADENVLMIVDNQKKEKVATVNQILGLENQLLGQKQKLDLQIKQLKSQLQIMKHMEREEVSTVTKKIAEMSEQLKEKIEVECLEDLKDSLVINEDDEKLRSIKQELGDGVYKALTIALLELNEHNPNGRFPLRELWNFDKQRKATLKEAIQFILTKLRISKRKPNVSLFLN